MPSQAHNEIINPRNLPRFKRLNAIPVMSFRWGKPGPDQNLFKVDPDLISETKVKQAMGGGKVIYRSRK